VSIDDFLPQEGLLSPERGPTQIIDISSEKKVVPLPSALRGPPEPKALPDRGPSSRNLTLETLLEGGPIFVVKRKKRPSMKYYWRNVELLRFHIVNPFNSNSNSSPPSVACLVPRSRGTSLPKRRGRWPKK
jgi:hypothetical protein